jgi:hypothetical protein
MSSFIRISWPVGIMIDPKPIRSRLFRSNIQLECWIFEQRIVKIVSSELKGLRDCKPVVTEGSQVIGLPPFVSETMYKAQVFQGAQNEARPFLWVEQKP